MRLTEWLIQPRSDLRTKRTCIKLDLEDDNGNCIGETRFIRHKYEFVDRVRDKKLKDLGIWIKWWIKIPKWWWRWKRKWYKTL